MESQREDEGQVDLSKVPASVNLVYVHGLSRTKNDIVHHHIQPLFEAKTFEELHRALNVTRQKYEQLGLFRSMKISVDVSKTDPGNEQAYDVHYKVREQRWIKGGVNLSAGMNESIKALNIVLPNLFGRGESLLGDVFWSTHMKGFGVDFTKPLFFEPHYTLRSSIFQNHGEFPWSGFKLGKTGVSLAYGFPSIFGNHTLKWEGVWRELSCISDSTAFAVREESGHSLKSSVKHILTRDTRDDPTLPRSGYLIKMVHEFAGLGGGAKFLKQEAELQYNQPLVWDSTLQLSLACGLATALKQPVTGRPGKVSIADRFFIGGPLNLRGFNFKGVGPRVDGYSLGGTAYWCSGLHLFTPLPFTPIKSKVGENFRTQFFVNAGNVGTFDPDIPYQENAGQLLNDFRLSAGLGIVIKLFKYGRLEINYCLPIKFSQTDSLNPGLQIGFGMSFFDLQE